MQQALFGSARPFVAAPGAARPQRAAVKTVAVSLCADRTGEARAAGERGGRPRLATCLGLAHADCWALPSLPQINFPFMKPKAPKAAAKKVVRDTIIPTPSYNIPAVLLGEALGLPLPATRPLRRWR